MTLSQMLLSALALLILSVPTHSDAAWKPWRSPDNGGVNALYCYLSINGVACEYRELLRDHAEQVGQGACSATTLVHLARKRGVRLRPVSLTMDELLSCPLPVLVHMDGTTPETGAFLLLCNNKGNSMYYLNGPTVTIGVISREDFRRVWTGVALLPATDWKRAGAFCLIGFGNGAILALIGRRYYKYLRRKQH